MAYARQKLSKFAIFSSKKPKKIIDLPKDTQFLSSPWAQCCAKPEKAIQAVQTMNEQANVQPTLTNGTGFAILTIFVTDCFQN